jgi:hypothetical protein
VSEPSAAASSIEGSLDLDAGEEMQVLRTGLELARASHLTMLRLQLALHKSNRRVAMQALDNLLEIDTEMEGLAATLNRVETRLESEAALFGFIGFQKEAIATEKHVLAQGPLQLEPQPVVEPAMDVQTPNAEPPGFSLAPGEKAERPDCADDRRWLYILAVSITFVILGWALLVALGPALTVTLGRI